MNEHLLPYIEWEVLGEPITFREVNDIQQLPKGDKAITIGRDEQYKLQVVLRSKEVIRTDSRGAL